MCLSSYCLLQATSVHWHDCEHMTRRVCMWSKVVCVCRENLGQWEKIARGEVEDVVPSRPCESGPVKVDNWLPKGFAGPPKEYDVNPATDLELCRKESPHPVWAGDRLAKGDLTLKTHSYLIGWRRCQHWRFHRSQRLTDSWWGWGTSTHHPASTQLGNSFGRMDLCCFGCFSLAVLCLFLFCFVFVLFFFYGLVFAEALLWTFHRLGYVKSCCRFRLFWKWYCLPSVVGLSYTHYFSKVFPETEGMCRADVWCNATLLRRWVSECFLLLFWAKILCSTWIKRYSLFMWKLNHPPPHPPSCSIFYKTWMNCNERS